VNIQGARLIACSCGLTSSAGTGTSRAGTWRMPGFAFAAACAAAVSPYSASAGPAARRATLSSATKVGLDVVASSSRGRPGSLKPRFIGAVTGIGKSRGRAIDEILLVQKGGNYIRRNKGPRPVTGEPGDIHRRTKLRTSSASSVPSAADHSSRRNSIRLWQEPLTPCDRARAHGPDGRAPRSARQIGSGGTLRPK
jgi:hypothetical protein